MLRLLRDLANALSVAMNFSIIGAMSLAGSGAACPVPLANVIRWREVANRVILSSDVGRLQIAVVAADRVVPIASVT